MKGFLDTAEQLAKIFGVFAAIFGVYKYYDALEQEKVNRSLAYYDEYHSGRVLTARIEVGKLSYIWLNSEKPDGSALTGTELAQLVLKDLSSLPSSIEYDIIVEFFARAKHCIEEDACERDTLVNLLSAEANDLYVYLFPKVLERRQAKDLTADALICFATGFETQGCTR